MKCSQKEKKQFYAGRKKYRCEFEMYIKLLGDGSGNVSYFIVQHLIHGRKTNAFSFQHCAFARSFPYIYKCLNQKIKFRCNFTCYDRSPMLALYLLGCFKSFAGFHDSTLNCNMSVNTYLI